MILYLAEGDPLGHMLLRRCREVDYDCHLVHGENEVIENLSDLRHQTVVLVDAKTTTRLDDNTEYNNLEHLSE